MVELNVLENLIGLAFAPLWIFSTFIVPIIGVWLVKKFIIH